VRFNQAQHARRVRDVADVEVAPAIRQQDVLCRQLRCATSVQQRRCSQCREVRRVEEPDSFVPE